MIVVKSQVAASSFYRIICILFYDHNADLLVFKTFYTTIHTRCAVRPTFPPHYTARGEDFNSYYKTSG